MSLVVERMPAAEEPVQCLEPVRQVLERCGHRPSRLVAILQAVQDQYNYLPSEVLGYVATALNLPVSRVFGVATFYAHFALSPRGKHIVRLCDGTACHVKRSIPILEALRKRLNLSAEKHTTSDMLFTVETVACLGACGLAPVMVVGDDVHGQVTPEAAVKLVDELVHREAAGAEPAPAETVSVNGH